MSNFDRLYIVIAKGEVSGTFEDRDNAEKEKIRSSSRVMYIIERGIDPDDYWFLSRVLREKGKLTVKDLNASGIYVYDLE